MSELERSAAGPEVDAALAAPASPASPAVEASEDEAWSAVLAAWGDEAAHLRYLSRFTDVEGLAIAGGRYKAVLEARPGDGVALRLRGEILKRATAYGMAALPRTTPAGTSRTVKAIRAAVALLALVAAVYCAGQLLAHLGVRL